MAEVEGLLVKVRTGAGFGLDAVRAFGDAEPILDVPAGTPNAFGVGAAEPAMWLKVASDGNAWDRAHSLLAGGYAADSSGVMAAEPDMGQSWVAEPSPKTTCQASGQDKSNGRAAGPRDGWHLEDAYSGLRTARASVPDTDQAKVTIAHLDTGWDPKHTARPRHVRLDKQINFTGEGARNDALDVTPKTGIFNRGHGPATVGLLAGGDPGFPIGGVAGPLGGAPGCQVIPIRIADSVVRLTTSTMVQGFKHALDCGADVLSMSMGGLASDAVADAINRCYEQGMVMVTAAGNFMPKIPTPRSIVYPARMRRVLAATGVMADGSPYFGGALTTMQGCHGPASKMETAIAGWTPNAPWVELGCGNVIDYDGSGTSAATPQVAATAALWLAKYHAQLAQYPKRWMRGEAARQALLQSARKTTAKLNQAQVRAALGAGSINAVAALALAPMKWDALRAAPVASADWAWLKLLSGEGVGVAPIGSPRARMLGLELLQVVQLDPALEALIEDPDAEGSGPSEADRKGFLEAVRDSEASSQTLKSAIDRALGNSGPTGPRTLPRAPSKTDTVPSPDKPRPPAPTKRRLRIFALDPSLGGTLDLVDSKIATVDVRYEKDADGNSILRPGPVGEYLEVVDVDPASDQFYPPVDLDDPRLLLQDGLEPSEGNPAFHQQMVYAVGMRTIASFEQALGRRALWSPHRREGQTWEYVPRLRLYPHALRARNAYYSPNLVSILFGYFPAESDRQDATAPGTLVFGCLSADIIAHEMTHALLDGYTRGYRESSNPDVGAFHEAFADIVALFQHFQYRDLIRREIARARGDLNAATLLGELARQFGEGISKRGALRDYLAENESEYSSTFEVHDRGALLVKAIYEAFLAIFTRRTGDLIRLATGGSGVLEPGEIHPDLVDRLTDEACKAAGHVLRMCIRAIDYLPPIDVTFGAYLRALITADVGQVEDDRFGYRTALIQAFRRRDLLPGNLRTVSVETLKWSPPREKSPPWLARAVEVLKVDWLHTLPRWQIYSNARDRSFRMHQLISEELERDPEAIARQLGLELGVPLFDKSGAVAREAKGKTTFEVRNVRAARRQRPDGQLAEEIIVTLAQRRPEPLDGRDVRNGFFWYRGGATLVINPSNERNEPEIKYLIWKRLGDGDRLERERAFRGFPPVQTSRSLYFGARGVAGDEPFALLHSAEN